jgi:molybdopterin converting factor small subunit
MQIRVRLHGLLTAGIGDRDRPLELTLPPGTEVAGVFEVLHERSPMIDARACLALVNGVKVPLNWPLQDGDEVNLYHLFSGG